MGLAPLIALVAAGAAASSPTAPPHPAALDHEMPPVQAKPGYGLQMVSLDAAILVAGVAAVGLSDGHPATVYTWLGLYLVAPPLLHAHHDRDARVVTGSALLRAALPTVGLLAGWAMPCNQEEEFLCDVGNMAAGFSVGYLAAALTDAIWLSGPREETRPSRLGLRSGGAALLPSRTGAVVTWGGTF